MQTKKINKALTSVLNKFDYTNMHRNIYTFFFLGGGVSFFPNPNTLSCLFKTTKRWSIFSPKQTSGYRETSTRLTWKTFLILPNLQQGDKYESILFLLLPIRMSRTLVSFDHDAPDPTARNRRSFSCAYLTTSEICSTAVKPILKRSFGNDIPSKEKMVSTYIIMVKNQAYNILWKNGNAEVTYI